LPSRNGPLLRKHAGKNQEETQISDFQELLVDPPLQEIYNYWHSLLGGRRMPARKDVDPVQIPRYLSDLMLIDVQNDPRRFRYRLIGTRIVSASAEDRTGQFFDDVYFFKHYPETFEHYNLVVDNAAPHLSLEPFRNYSNNTSYQAKRLILPLANDGETVDMLMVYFHFTTGPFAKR